MLSARLCAAGGAGCLCCAVGLPFQVAINRLLSEERPDRLLVEPTGLGHPKKTLEILRCGFFKKVLDVRASIGLVDSRKLDNPRYIEHEIFIEQIAMADVLVANKMDLTDEAAKQRFTSVAALSEPAKSVVAQVIKGRMNPSWLDLPANPERTAAYPDMRRHLATNSAIVKSENPEEAGLSALESGEHQGDGFYSRGWTLPKDILFDYQRLSECVSNLAFERVKGVFNTNKGWFAFNLADSLLSVTQLLTSADNRIEVIGEKTPPNFLKRSILICAISGECE